MVEERKNAATLRGNPITLLGPELKPGDKAPDAVVSKSLTEEVRLSDYSGKVRLISSVPSLDTGVCDAQTRRFNEEAAKLGDDVVVLTISADLPMAQARWCGAAGVDRVVVLSDHKHMDFGNKYGLHIKELRLDMRAVFVIDRDDTIRYVQVLREMAEHPDYDAASAAVKSLL